MAPDRDGGSFLYPARERELRGRLAPAGERGMPMSSLTYSAALTDEEVAELKARHLALSYLVKGCQDAVFNFRRQSAPDAGAKEARAAHRTVEILEEVLASWCDTLSILRSALNPTSSLRVDAGQRLDLYPGVFTNEAFQRMPALRAQGGPDSGG